MAKKHYICDCAELREGERKLVQVGSRSVGLFNVRGSYHALLNVCPHTGGTLCEGPIGGTNKAVDLKDGYQYVYEREGEILRCAWHGWEFDIATGECLSQAGMNAKRYPVEIEDGKVYVVA